MGCPNKDIEKQGAGAMLIKNPKLAKKIIRATKKGAGSMPVSVKTRIGYSKNEIEKWIPALLEENLAALTIHFRTRNEAWKPPAHWEMAKKIVNLRNEISPNTLILGNGDVKSLTEAKNLAKKTGLDGIMIGRGIMANPWLFSMSKTEPSMPEKLKTLIKHTERFEKINKNNIDKNGKIKNFDSVKKFFKAYTSGFKGGKELRERLMKAKNAKEIKVIINDFYLKKDKN
jgi:tRNA-dihydrouridine synthase